MHQTDVWLEKYRPHVLEHVEGNPEVLSRLRNLALIGNMPNLLLAGPPGTGKTTSVLALAHHLLGVHTKRAVLELNASDDRGIDVVRNKIKSFAKEKIELPEGKHKLIILDEVDSMTEGAQQALRRLMEIHSDTTRFALACNESTKIIEPIQSRCAILRFSKLKEHEILKRLLYICEHENVNHTEEGMQLLIFTANGDMRNAVNNLQSTVNGFKSVTADNVMKVCDMPSPELVKSILNHCLTANWREAYTASISLLQDGYSPIDIVAVMKPLLRRSSISESISLEYLKCVTRCHYIMLDGVASQLQLSALLTRLCNVALDFSSETKSSNPSKLTKI